MTRIEHEVVIDRPVDEVWEFLMEPANEDKWQTSLVEVRPHQPGPLEAGSRVTEVRRFLGRRLETTWEVIEHDRPRRSAIKLLSGPIPGSGSWNLEPTNGGTKMTWVLELDAGGFFKIAEPVFARMAKREIEANCGHLKDILESRAIV